MYRLHENTFATTVTLSTAEPVTPNTTVYIQKRGSSKTAVAIVAVTGVAAVGVVATAATVATAAGATTGANAFSGFASMR